jgi:signal peptidase II
MSRKKTAPAWALFLGLGLAVTALDLYTKEIAFDALKVDMESIRFAKDPRSGDPVVFMGFHTPSGRRANITVIDGFFELEASLNRGAFSGWFSQFTGALAWLSLVALVAIAIFFWTLVRRSSRMEWLSTIALGLLWGGTAGNLYDRYFLGAVRDFIKWYVVVGGEERVWPNFNIADSSICVGVALLMLQWLRDGARSAKTAASPPPLPPPPPQSEPPAS